MYYSPIFDADSFRWIAEQISKILGNDDDVVIELCFNLLEGTRFVRLFSSASEL